nr:hypothetical protein Iba_chr06bCG3060 [Ipomoea batatas]
MDTESTATAALLSPPTMRITAVKYHSSKLPPQPPQQLSVQNQGERAKRLSLDFSNFGLGLEELLDREVECICKQLRNHPNRVFPRDMRYVFVLSQQLQNWQALKLSGDIDAGQYR